MKRVDALTKVLWGLLILQDSSQESCSSAYLATIVPALYSCLTACNHNMRPRAVVSPSPCHSAGLFLFIINQSDDSPPCMSFVNDNDLIDIEYSRSPSNLAAQRRCQLICLRIFNHRAGYSDRQSWPLTRNFIIPTSISLVSHRGICAKGLAKACPGHTSCASCSSGNHS